MSEAESDSDNEPTMEEILASIRKIISEDEPEEAAPAKSRGQAAPEDEPEDEAEETQPLELTQMVDEDGKVVDLRGPQQGGEAPRAKAAKGRAAAVPPEVPAEMPAAAAEESEIEPESEESVSMADNTAPVHEVPAKSETTGPGGLVSAATAAMATSAMSKISENLESERPVKNLSGGDKTIEALVREALAAHLKDWLDANLPDLVESVVREEIQKMVKRAEYR